MRHMVGVPDEAIMGVAIYYERVLLGECLLRDTQREYLSQVKQHQGWQQAGSAQYSSQRGSPPKAASYVQALALHRPWPSFTPMVTWLQQRGGGGGVQDEVGRTLLVAARMLRPLGLSLLPPPPPPPHTHTTTHTHTPTCGGRWQSVAPAMPRRVQRRRRVPACPRRTAACPPGRR